MVEKITKDNALKRRRGPGGPGPRGMTNTERAKDFKGTLRKLINYLGAYKMAILLVAAFAVASTVFTIVGPKILGRATTEIFKGLMASIANTGGGINFVKIGGIIFKLVMLYFTSAAFQAVQSLIMTQVAVKVTYRMRRDVFAKMNRLPFAYYDQTSYGEVLSYMTNDIETINQSLTQSLTQIVTAVTTIVGILVMMFSISWQMTLIALCIVPVSGGLAMLVIRRSQREFAGQQAYLGHINGHIEEVYGGHTVIQAYNKEADATVTFEKYNDKLYTTAWKSQFMSGMMMPIMTFVTNLGYVGECILGGYLAVHGRVEVGDIQAFITYVRQFNQPITQVANISNVLQMTMAASERIFAFLDEPEESADPERAVPTDAVRGRITFEHVGFGYLPGKPVIRDFSVDVQPGQKVAIVGPTGAGKTTIVKLLMRFYDIDRGRILIDGRDSRDFARSDLRRIFGMVLQDTWLTSGTIEDNIRYGNFAADHDAVVRAAKTAQVDHFVRTQAEGYDTVLGEEGGSISQGQKQLLTIARAILADPRVLILDEATSSVDTRTEVMIQRAMDNLMAGRTSFIIAHRLSTIQNADVILVLRDGDIVEQGSHEALLAQNGFYADLYNSQWAAIEDAV
ncbi:ABC transporter ATP-binding protein [Pseudoramibacter alactolyticus]|uniref:ABC transporter ATP-binding protein n=1 Tax=Pseudoramibacter alactolyticus TaxID=113287 RepID=UPI00248E9F7A|nr:ABC transporter ATP-binding protein [Pseudoramibacter alactolyticus]